MHQENEYPVFPSVDEADEDGLLCIGGDLSLNRLRAAYQSGIFPWYTADEPICWYSPDPRFVLFPERVRISHSMRAVLRRTSWELRINAAFTEVMQQCRDIIRNGQSGESWIHTAMQQAYTALHQAGDAHSFECYVNGELAGGFYGVLSGQVFCGESMFSRISNASKYAFIQAIPVLQSWGVTLIDCQVYTTHLKSLGAGFIPRKTYLSILQDRNRFIHPGSE